MVEIISLLAIVFGSLMSLAHLPQAYKIVKRKSSKDVSLITYFVFTFGAYVWLVYGIVIIDFPVIITYSIASVSTTSTLILSVVYR